MKLFPLLLAFTFLAGSQDDTFSLTWKPKANDTADYRLSMEFEIGSEKMAYEMDTLMKVTKVEENGEYEVETRTKNGIVRVGGEEQKIEDDEEVTTDRYDAKGQAIKKAGQPEEDEEGSDPLADNILDPVMDFVPPDAPIKKGTTWSHETKSDDKKGIVAAKVDYEVMGAERRDDYDCVRVNFKMKQSEGSSPAKSEGHFLISRLDGSLVDFVIKFEGFKPDEAEDAGSGTVKMIRK